MNLFSNIEHGLCDMPYEMTYVLNSIPVNAYIKQLLAQSESQQIQFEEHAHSTSSANAIIRNKVSAGVNAIIVYGNKKHYKHVCKDWYDNRSKDRTNRIMCVFITYYM